MLRTILAAVSGFALTGLVLAGSAQAQQVTGRVNVITSFAKDVTDPFKSAFEKKYPGVTIEMQNRNTNAGVKHPRGDERQQPDRTSSGRPRPTRSRC